jgi:hypothetical protein
MKLFFVPNPWDYHGMGGFYIVARDVESVKKKLTKHLGAEDDDYFTRRSRGQIKWDEITEIKGGIAVASGCDC